MSGSAQLKSLRRSIPLALLLISITCLVRAEVLPERLSDQEFWKFVEQASEPEQQFPGENYVSNEPRYPAAVRLVKQDVATGGAYLGVGPEQNFTYIAAMRPKIAFIIDIRRQNMAEHLMYKALFEVAENRMDFLSRLFSRRKPDRLSPSSTIQELMDAYLEAPPSPQAFDENRALILETLNRKHGFRLSDTDNATVERILKVFAISGAQTNYNSGGNNPNAPPLYYSALMAAADASGNRSSYLATEENYRVVRDLQLRNLIVPVVGDFAGPKAIRAIGSYLKNHDTTVGLFYLSNVETYLFAGSGPGAPTAAARSITPNGGWRAFFQNVSTLPLDSASTFLRFQGAAGEGRLASIQKNLDRVNNNTIQAFPDLFRD